MACSFLLLFFAFSVDVGFCAPPGSPARGKTDAIASYFYDGYQYRMILTWLGLAHGVRVSLSTLKRILRQLGLRRKARVTVEHLCVVETLMRVSFLLVCFIVIINGTHRKSYKDLAGFSGIGHCGNV